MQNRLFTSLNVKLFVVALIVLAVGYYCMGRGPITNAISWSVAPVLLVIAYCILIPLAIAVKVNPVDSEKK